MTSRASLLNPRSIFTAALALVLALMIGIASACSSNPVDAAGRVLPAAKIDEPLAAHSGSESIVLAGGCFWGVQLVFQNVRGVISATSGYAGGTADTATYPQVGTETTGHAESVKIVYDPSVITEGRLLRIFFSVATDPTELDRQGPDVGSSYRSVIFYSNPEQLRIARAYIDQLTEAKVFAQPIVTELTELTPQRNFYRAEAYHQNFARLHPDNPYIRINDLPKLAALKAEFPKWVAAHPAPA